MERKVHSRKRRQLDPTYTNTCYDYCDDLSNTNNILRPVLPVIPTTDDCFDRCDEVEEQFADLFDDDYYNYENYEYNYDGIDDFGVG